MNSRTVSHVVAAIATLLAPDAISAQRSPAASRAALLTRIDSIVSSAMPGTNAGIQVAVIRGRDTIVMKAYGLADVEHDIPVSAQTVFKIGSVTKQFTSAAVMQLVEQRKLSLNDTLGRFMPNAPAHWHRVTIRQLLNHTSGIPSFTDVGPKSRVPRIMGMRRDSIFELLRGDSLMFEPGRGFYYNNTGYYLLGMLVEHLSGKTYAAYVEEMIKPLGLRGTTYCGGRDIIKHRAHGYDPIGTSWLNTDVVDMDITFSVGSLCSTARDLVQWASALTSGRVVNAESFQLMATPVAIPTVYRMNYGFALIADSIGRRRTVEHSGNINGFSSNLLTVPRDSLFIAVNINASRAPATAISNEIARAVLGEARVDITPRVEPISAAERAKFTGRYRIGEPSGVRREYIITEQDEHLTLIVPGGGPPMILERIGKREFAVRGQSAPRVQFEMSGDTVAGIVIARGLRPLMGSRVH
ncbi:MAG: serine hydrolase domain-containing protein [Gemmatimonadota bacterium]